MMQVTQMVMSYVQNKQMQGGEQEEESGFNEDDYQEAIKGYQE